MPFISSCARNDSAAEGKAAVRRRDEPAETDRKVMPGAAQTDGVRGIMSGWSIGAGRGLGRKLGMAGLLLGLHCASGFAIEHPRGAMEGLIEAQVIRLARR